MGKQERTVEKTYDLLAGKYHNDRTVLKKGSFYYNECIEMPTTLAMAGNVRGKRVLDVGCGTGIYAKHFLEKGARVCGVEKSESMLSIARNYAPGAEFRRGTAYKLPYTNCQFDIVIAALMIDHVADLSRMFREVKRVLKPGGYFVFSGPNPIIECRVQKSLGNLEYRILGHTKDKKSVFGDYYKEGWRKVNWGNCSMYHYHRTYESLLNNTAQSGLKLVEYRDAKPTAKKIPGKDWKHIKRVFTRLPLFCVFKLQKPCVK